MSVSELLRHYQLHLRKGLGQHLLADPNILDRIVQAAELTADSLVLEVGPGLGTLTRRLAEAAGRVIAVELDEEMVRALRQELAGLPNLTLVSGDILQLDPAALLASAAGTAGQPYTAVANLPYYITSAAIRHLLECRHPPRRLVLTVQREVAQRIEATPAT